MGPLHVVTCVPHRYVVHFLITPKYWRIDVSSLPVLIVTSRSLTTSNLHEAVVWLHWNNFEIASDVVLINSRLQLVKVNKLRTQIGDGSHSVCQGIGKLLCAAGLANCMAQVEIASGAAGGSNGWKHRLRTMIRGTSTTRGSACGLTINSATRGGLRDGFWAAGTWSFTIDGSTRFILRFSIFFIRGTTTTRSGACLYTIDRCTRGNLGRAGCGARGLTIDGHTRGGLSVDCCNGSSNSCNKFHEVSLNLIINKWFLLT